MAGHSWNTPKFGTAGNLWHCRDALLLDTAGILCQDTLWFDNAGKLGRILGWAEAAVKHCRDILRLGTAGMRCGCAPGKSYGWPLQGECGGGRGRESLELSCFELHIGVL